jgi:serine/threonine-protein kinase
VNDGAAEAPAATSDSAARPLDGSDTAQADLRSRVVAPAPIRRGEAHARRQRAPAQRVAEQLQSPGFLTVDATPWATIFVDGKSLGITPLISVQLPEGRHTLVARTQDGREQRMTLRIASGQTMTRRIQFPGARR